jgi:hypothetical protein
MNGVSKLVLQILPIAVVLGVLGDWLLRATPWGLNVPLWTLAVLASAVVLSIRHRIDGARHIFWLALPVLLFAIGFAWRDSPAVQFFDAFAVMVAVSIWSGSREGSRIHSWGVLDCLRGLLNTGVAAVAGAALLPHKEIVWPAMPGTAKWKYARSGALGLLIALPLLFVFGGLLMAADAVFDQMVTDVLDIDFASIFSHSTLTVFFAWTVCGFLLLLFGISRPAVSESQRVDRPGLGIVEIAVPLALIDLLFVAFVIVQLRYLFGDSSLVETTTGLTYSEYARRGFFELVTVAFLALPLLLLGDWVLAEADSRSRRIFQGLAGVLLLLLAVIVASAIQRMRLYQVAYGLTELRLYTTAFMTWIGAVLAWFAVTVLRGHRRPFAAGAAIAGFCVIAALNVLNPDALIAKVNTDRARAGEEFDVYYATRLSADAVPTLLSALPTLDLEDRCVAAARLLERWTPPEDKDWRTWNRGRLTAWRVVDDASARLSALACEVPVPTDDHLPGTSPADTAQEP